ncbi:hypothetical protein [Mucilaginibacter lappiensis]|uniref:Uncharacterized protein n=1 Tax=Mucilaginibacter lappiensis TaxID=354630 RepID=A0A841JE31_9SPHI|nr:hypothetical protein [Mucilaginibacter lappiensis]MBB6129409.1 hypothetical protein [Mucilaginibacter lappiensis]
MKKSLNLNKFAENGTLSIFVNSEQEPMGILIPLKQWSKIAPSVDKNCELHRLMEQLTFKPIFERSLKEQENWLCPEIEQVETANLQQGLYNIYQDDKYCTSKDLFIHQYTDHRELVKVDAETGHTQTIKRNF